MSWLDELRERDPEAAAVIDEQHRLEAIGFKRLQEQGRLHATPVGYGASWYECQQAGLEAEREASES